MNPIPRRQFLCLAGSATAALLLRNDAALAKPRGLQRWEHSAQALGTQVSIVALHEREQVARSAVQRAFAELELVESLMSIYRPESQLSALNRQGVLDQPHPYLVEVLTCAADFSRRTEGAFDVTVQPLWQLYHDAKKRNAIPTQAAIDAARAKIDWRRVEIASHRVRLRGEGTQITLNGIAQGFAADRVSTVLKQHGVENALIDTGEFVAAGRNTLQEPWRIGIQHPRHADAYLSLARLTDRCLSTSGDYATTFSADFLHHHIFDPHTGKSPTQLASVTVLAETALQADALSTAVFVLGLDRGMQLLESMGGCDALIATRGGHVRMTRGFPWETT